MKSSALWGFAHRALSPQFHEDPARFIARLDGAAAGRYLEEMWAWALRAVGQAAPAKPPLAYGIDRPDPTTAIVWMQFRDVTETGEPWLVRFVHAPPSARMFLLEHDAYASELDGAPRAIVCESLSGGGHANWGVVLAPDDEVGFARAVADRVHPPS